MHVQTYEGPAAAQAQAAVAGQQASIARAQADVAREAAAAARAQTREQVEMLDRQIEAMRDAERMSRDGARPIILRPPPSRVGSRAAEVSWIR